jgi:hypothetical protein
VYGRSGDASGGSSAWCFWWFFPGGSFPVVLSRWFFPGGSFPVVLSRWFFQAFLLCAGFLVLAFWC